MQVVIEVSEEQYNALCMKGVMVLESQLPSFLKALRNGTPLPKGHGDLIAEPTEEEIAETIGGNNDFAECIREAVKAVFDNAKTIIPADKEGEDKE